MMMTKAEKALKIARRVLTVRKNIVSQAMRQSNRRTIDRMQLRTRSAICHQRVAEAEARVRRLRPPTRIDPVKQLEDRKSKIMAQVEMEAEIRFATEQKLRELAGQAAMDRATFIKQVKRELPKELWEEVIDDYDRRAYESRGGEVL
ncbi:MAG: hypothetical protein HRF51_00225 [bacterium]